MKLNNWLIVLLTVGILALANYLFTALPVKFDLTAQKDYSLSEETKNIVRGLDDVVNVTVYLSADLPARVQGAVDGLRDLLTEYSSYSMGKLKIKYVDPGDDPNLLQEAQSLGIPKLQFSNIEGEQLQVTQGYFGLNISYLDKNEPIPFIESTANLEYELTSRLAGITRSEPIKIAFSTGHNESSGLDELGTISQVLSQAYEVSSTEVSTASGELIDQENRLLVMVDPKTAFTADEKYLLDQYLMSGRSILLAADEVMVDSQLMATPVDLGLSDWLSHFGLTINRNLVLDQSSEIASFSTGTSNFIVPYPFWVKVIGENINPQHASTNGLETVLLPWVSGLDVKTDQANPPTVLLSSSANSWLQSEPFDLNPTQDYVPPDDGFSSYPLAAIVDNNLTSAFSDDAVPPQWSDQHLSSTSEGKLAVISNSDFIKDSFVGNFRTNAAFFLNLVEYLSSDINLSAIRTKGETIRPLRQIPDSQKGWIKYGNIFGISAVVALLGLVWITKRNKTQP